MESPELPENRRHARVEQELEVRLYEGAGPVDGWAEVCDLGLGGMRLKAPISLPVGSHLRFRLSLPRLGELEGAARVRWNQACAVGCLHGLEFTGLGLLDRRLLTRYLFPNRFGPFEALDLGLQCALTLACLFAARDLLVSDPALRATAVDLLPPALVVGTAGLALIALLRRRCR